MERLVDRLRRGLEADHAGVHHVCPDDTVDGDQPGFVPANIQVGGQRIDRDQVEGGGNRGTLRFRRLDMLDDAVVADRPGVDHAGKERLLLHG